LTFFGGFLARPASSLYDLAAMSISHTVLGDPGADNALHVVVDSGQAHCKLLFDCGEGCAAKLKISTLQAIEHLCFSHFHMDHVAGFDTFFRHNYNRPDAPVHIWGPAQTIDVMHHRFRSFSWNLHEGQPGEWQVHEIGTNEIRSAAFFATEAFATNHPLASTNSDAPIISNKNYRIEARILDHGTTPSIGYRIVESDRKNIESSKLTELGLQPGPWLGLVTDLATTETEPVSVGGKEYRVGELRDKLLVTRPGESLAYLTDFSLSDNDRESVVDWLKGTDVLVCEAQYRHQDRGLAAKHHHMTTRLVGELARDAAVGELVLQHVSRRYTNKEWLAMLDEAKVDFPMSRFPESWNL
jgi:ribonuclease Z